MSVSPAKTAGTNILALQSVASNVTIVGSAIDVSTKFAAFVGIHFGRTVNNALTEAVQIRVEGSVAASGDGQWFSLAEFITQSAAVTREAVTTQASAGQNVVIATTTTGLTADYASTSPPGNRVFLFNVTIANSEFHTVKLVTASTSITLEDNLANIQQTTAFIVPGAEFFTALLDLSAIARIRVVVAANNTGFAVAVEANMVTEDSIG